VLDRLGAEGGAGREELIPLAPEETVGEERLDRDLIGFATELEAFATELEALADQGEDDRTPGEAGRVQVEDAAEDGVLAPSTEALGGPPGLGSSCVGGHERRSSSRPSTSAERASKLSATRPVTRRSCT
jgi:hypothetical protein